jgi:two-component sensor histidine kinase
MAVAPVLILSFVQSLLVFHRERADERAELADAARRSAISVAGRIASAAVHLGGLGAESSGAPCAARLAEIRDSLPDYANLIRFDEDGVVTCSAAPAAIDPDRRDRPWFRALAKDAAMTVTLDPGARYAAEPSLLVSVPARNDVGRPEGVLTAVVTLASLRPQTDTRFVPEGAEVSLTDATGRHLTASRASAFQSPSRPGPQAILLHGVTLWVGRDGTGLQRVFATAALPREDLQVQLSAPYRTILAWAWRNAVSAILLPLAAFGIALGGVWLVADREVVRWISYLQRIARIYARGRYSVHPERAQHAPLEIRELALSLDTMAATMAARDRALRDSLIQKDALLREIHHRVKNNLQVISSLLNMQQRALTDPAARAAMSDTRLRITALALIYRALYEGPDLRRVDLREFLENLIAQLVMTDRGTRSSIRTDLTIDAVTIDPDHLAPLALFAVEAITNAKKHGLADGHGRLSVGFRVTGALAELTITDSGRRDASPPAVGEGVGRTLMMAFARQLGGEVRFCPRDEGGLMARLTFPTAAADLEV